MEVWVVSNPGPNAVGCPHPRPGEGRIDLQLEPFGFAVWTDEEKAVWDLSVPLRRLVAGNLVTLKKMPMEQFPAMQTTMPKSIEPEHPLDRYTAYQIAMAPAETDDIQLARINLFRGSDGKEWADEADRTYLRTRHLQLLKAARWWLEEFVTKRTTSQNRRLKDTVRQIKAIEKMM